MSRGTKYTAEEKHEILTAYENGIGSMNEIATKYEISVDTFCHGWVKYLKQPINKDSKKILKSQMYLNGIKQYPHLQYRGAGIF